MNNTWRYKILIAILLVPLFFINVKTTHDWGDDFAQYLIQARNIVEGRPQTENGLIVNEKGPAYAIEAYPVGLPLLLSPIYYFSKLSIQPYNIFFSSILFLSGLFCFELFRKRTTSLVSIIITLLFCYNITTIDLKKQILSEIPFTAFLIFLLFWPELSYYRKKYSWIITGLLLALLVSIRLVGLAGVIAFIIFELNNIRKTADLSEKSKSIIKLLFSLITSVFFFLLLNDVWFKINAGGLLGFYSGAFASHEIQASNNLNFYYIVSEYVFPFYGKWISRFWIFMALSGWLIRFIKKASLSEFFLPIYSAVIIFYPYSDAGLRFLLPILPLLIYYGWYFIFWIFSWTGETAKWISTSVLIIVLSAYIAPLKITISEKLLVEKGPLQKESIELFNFVKTTPSNAAIVFCKARAMALYSGRQSLYMAKNQNNAEAFIQFHRYKLLYLVVAKAIKNMEINDPRLLNFISVYQENYEQVWDNENFIVYRQRF